MVQSVKSYRIVQNVQNLSQEGLNAGQDHHGKLNLIEYVIEDLHPNDLGMLAFPPGNAASEMRFRGSVDAG